MLNIICHVTDSEGKTLRYTVKLTEGSTVQNLVDRIQSRFNNEPLSKVQRNDRIQEPANILFFDEVVEQADEFFFSFERSNSETATNGDYSTDMPTFEQIPPVNQPMPPSSEGSPQSTQQAEIKHEGKQEIIGTEQIIVPLTPALSQITVESVVKGSTKAEQIVEKLKRCESIEPGERQLLVRIAGRWLMECCSTRMKPTSAERAFFAREFFGNLPNFKYDIKDFHNSQSRGFLDVFIYNERDRKTRSGEINRPTVQSDTLVRSLKRKYNRMNPKDEQNPFAAALIVPPESIISLTKLEKDEQEFETRYVDIINKEFGGNMEIAGHLAARWEESLAPKILRYTKKVNADVYQKIVGGQDLSPNVISNSALRAIPHLVRRLHRESTSTKINYLLANIDPVDDEHVLTHMRTFNDPGPFIATDEKNYVLVISDKILACEQSSSIALEKFLKSYFVYNLGNSLSQLRKAMVTLLLLCFGLAKTTSSSFKEVCQCIMNIT